MVHQSLRHAMNHTARSLIALVFMLLVVPRALGGHEVPERVAINAFVRPEAGVLRLVARVPLEAMRDVDFPIRADGTLDVAGATALLPDAAQLWVAGYLTAYENGRALEGARVAATRISLPSDRAFESYEGALAHLGAEPLGEDTGLRWQQALFDVVIEWPITSPTSRFALEPRLAHLGVRTVTVLRFLPYAAEANARVGELHAFTYSGDPGRIDLTPSAARAARRFVALGFSHIVGGIDHILFVLCLVLPVRRWRPLVAIVTAFTLAHSLTLGAAALGMTPTASWFPALVEAMIAASIVWIAAENVLLGEERLAQRWRMAFVFGLVHGFGFSFALGEKLQFAGGHLVASLAAFNIGVELGQLAMLAVALPVLAMIVRRIPVERRHLVTWVGSALIAHTAWHWMTARVALLGEYRAAFAWPAFDAAFALGAMRVTLLALVALALALAMQQILRLVRVS